ncbi:hypothetical protein GCM10023345_26720 [Acinetobacter kookii]|uniref:Uncharacterized protein n=1 Tax=Acinetobacter kookii TaxID=1226327 RepID=A0A1G6KMA0_9GAMM|nr:hypothetical protein [Acinetobacter kookii]SDC32094.1 hypothetical protein SAMN05421732_10565 [Acinetobacter kookii]
MTNYESCSCKKIFSQKENKSSFRLHNSNYYICEVKIDGGLINVGNKCDWLYKVYENDCKSRLNNPMVNCPTNITCTNQQLILKETIFIELKGEDLEKAVLQIEATHDYLKNNHPDYLCKTKKAYAVTTRCPSKSSELDIIKRKLKKSSGITLDRLKPNSDIHL